MSSERQTLLEEPPAQLALRHKLAYAVGHVLNDMFSAAWLSYVLVYCEHVVGMGSYLGMLVVVAGQTAEFLMVSVSIVLLEYNLERCCTCCERLGRRKAWYLIGTLQVAGSFLLLLTPMPGASSVGWGGQFVYYVSMAVMANVGFSIVQVTHLAMIPELVQSDSDKVDLNSFRYTSTQMANIVVYFSGALLFGVSSNSLQQFSRRDVCSFEILALIISVGGSIVSFVFLIFTPKSSADILPPPMQLHLVSSTSSESVEKDSDLSQYLQIEKEDEDEDEEQCGERDMTYRDWLCTKQFYQVGIIYVSSRIIVVITQIYIPIYLVSSLHVDKIYIPIVPLCVNLSGFVMSLFVKRFERCVGRKTLLLLSACLVLTACLWLLLEPEGVRLQGMIVLPSAVLGAGSSAFSVQAISLCADLIGPRLKSSTFLFGSYGLSEKLMSVIILLALTGLNLLDNDVIGNALEQRLFVIGPPMLSSLATLSVLAALMGTTVGELHPS